MHAIQLLVDRLVVVTQRVASRRCHHNM